MLAFILFSLLLFQKMSIDKIAAKYPGRDPRLMHKRASIGLLLLGLISLLNIFFNITLHRGWWNGDFFSPFINGFKN